MRYRAGRRIYTECISERAFYPPALEAFIIKNQSLYAKISPKNVDAGFAHSKITHDENY